jgi:hypothetical protein
LAAGFWKGTSGSVSSKRHGISVTTKMVLPFWIGIQIEDNSQEVFSIVIISILRGRQIAFHD